MNKKLSKNVEIARELKDKGVDTKLIAEITNLTEKEIKEIK